MTFPCATIDANALRHNLGVVRRLAPASRVMAVVKANAYGHGLTATARALEAADALGVARLGEGLALRAQGIDAPIVLLEGVFGAEELVAAAEHRLEIVVHSTEQLHLFAGNPHAHRFAVWLKLDSGMNRLGFRLESFPEVWQRLRSCPNVGQVRLMTHLAGAEQPGDAQTAKQIRDFRATADELAERAGIERSIANSAGLIGWPDARTEWIRPGVMLYGISPMTDLDASSLGLRPAMTLTTELIAVRRVPAGEAVGYGGVWRATRDSRIGIAAIGYGDGYPRTMRNGAPVLVKGRLVALVGRVSMDMLAVDVTEVDNAQVGDKVTLWGEGLPAERVAPYADTIAYELVCGVSQRVAVEWKK